MATESTVATAIPVGSDDRGGSRPSPTPKPNRGDVRNRSSAPGGVNVPAPMSPPSPGTPRNMEPLTRTIPLYMHDHFVQKSARQRRIRFVGPPIHEKPISKPLRMNRGILSGFFHRNPPPPPTRY